MRHARALLIVFLVWAFCTGALADELPRAASVSVCTDQYLLTLADPDQIAAVSWQARGPRSPVREQARSYPVVRGMAEEILSVQADVVLFDPYGNPETARRLGELGTEVIRLSDPVTFEDVEAEVRRVAATLGRPERGRAVSEWMERRRHQLQQRETDDRPLALYISPGGGGAGAGTYVNEVLTLAGFRNLQAELGYSGWQRIPLERLVETPPDVIVLSFFETTDPSLLDGFARHPMFRRLLARTPVIAVPAAPWVCAGPYLPEAAERLATERERLFPAFDEVAGP